MRTRQHLFLPVMTAAAVALACWVTAVPAAALDFPTGRVSKVTYSTADSGSVTVYFDDTEGSQYFVDVYSSCGWLVASGGGTNPTTVSFKGREHVMGPTVDVKVVIYNSSHLNEWHDNDHGGLGPFPYTCRKYDVNGNWLSAPVTSWSTKKRTVARVGRTLSITRTTPGPGTQVSYRWLVGTKVVKTGSRYLMLRRAYRGKRVLVKVIARNTGYQPVTHAYRFGIVRGST